MGKCLACLLAAAGMIAAHPAFAHEQTRRVQEELRNRHLFYGNMTGEYSPELMTALKRYQARKGLGATGIIDQSTLVSLDIAGSPPPMEGVSFVNGQSTPPVEGLPGINAQGTAEPAIANDAAFVAPGSAEQEHVTPSPLVPDSPEPRLRYSTAELLALMRSDDEAAEPFEPDFDLASAALVRETLGAMWDGFALEPLRRAESNLIAMSDEAAPPAERPKHASHFRVHRVHVRKQRNPIVMAFASIDHAMRNFFHPAGKKTRVAKRS